MYLQLAPLNRGAEICKLRAVRPSQEIQHLCFLTARSHNGHDARRRAAIIVVQPCLFNVHSK